MRTILVICVTLVATTAYATEPVKDAIRGLTTITAQNYPYPTVQMGPAACLIGPLTIFDPAQNVLMHLDAGATFGDGCADKK